MSNRSSRKRRQRSRAASAGSFAAPEPTSPAGSSPSAETPSSAPPAEAPSSPPSTQDFMERGYARGRIKDEEARAKLVPLAPGERPTAVTVGAIAAAVLSVANLIALAFGYNTDESRLTTGTILAAVVLAVIAYGMWRARYWAVLGMQTLLAITIIFACLALVSAYSWWAAILMVLIAVAAGTLFWFLIKAMARIQMPQRPGASN